jgi:cell division protein FtsB
MGTRRSHFLKTSIYTKMKRNVLSVLLVFCIIITLVSCHSGDNGIWKNTEIDSGLRSQIAALNKKLFTSIMAKDINGVKALLSDKLVQKSGTKLDTLVYTSAQSFNAKDYDVLDEYYTKHHVKADPDTLSPKKTGDDNYMVSYKAMNAEMYTSLLVTKGLPVNCLILAVYGKYGNDWKINVLQIGEYSIENKIAPDYYKIAQQQYANGSLVDASNTMIITSQLASPAGEFFKYTKEDTMKIFYSSIINKANNLFQFPVVMSWVDTKPKIFSVSPQYIEEASHRGIFPLIKYKTSIKLTDTTALRAENDAIQKHIGDLFKGIDQNKKYILYQAFNEMEGGKVPAKHYGFIQNLK